MTAGAISMTAEERRALEQVVGQATSRLALRTRTKIDTGGWAGKTRLLLVVFDADLVLLAIGRRRYVESVAMADIASSRYCHSSGSLMLVGDAPPRFHKLRITPMEALSVLHLIEQADESITLNPITDTENDGA